MKFSLVITVVLFLIIITIVSDPSKEEESEETSYIGWIHSRFIDTVLGYNQMFIEGFIESY